MYASFYSFEKIYYVTFAVVSVPVNLLAIVILSRGKCGLSTCTTRYLVAMAAADLLLVITNAILYRIIYYYFPRSFMNITTVSCFILTVSHTAGDCSVWFTVIFSFDRFVAICCQKLKTKYCTKKTANVVLATAGILFCLKNVPYYFSLGPAVIIDNVPLYCFHKPSLYTEPGWVGYDRFAMVLTPLVPFTLILLINALTVRHILVTSRLRKGLKGQSNGDTHSDPEMDSRRKSVILLFAISGNFILLWLTYVICLLFSTIKEENPDDNDSTRIIRQVGVMLVNLCCCTNTLLYGVSQSKFREQFKKAVKYPIASLIQIINKQK